MKPSFRALAYLNMPLWDSSFAINWKISTMNQEASFKEVEKVSCEGKVVELCFCGLIFSLQSFIQVFWSSTSGAEAEMVSEI